MYMHYRHIPLTGYHTDNTVTVEGMIVEKAKAEYDGTCAGILKNDINSTVVKLMHAGINLNKISVWMITGNQGNQN